MRLLALMVLLTLAVTLAPVSVEAQPVYRIGLLATTSAPANRVDALRAGLRDPGYIEGKNIVIEYRWAEGHCDRLPGLVAELDALKVDVIETATAWISRTPTAAPRISWTGSSRAPSPPIFR